MNIRLLMRLGLRWLAAVLLLLTVITPSIEVQAQGETVLQVTPGVTHVPLGDKVLFRLEVKDGVDVNAFDLSIAYDEDKLELISWAYGDYLSNLFSFYKKEQTGYFRLAAAQLATPAVSGDGVLLELWFSAKAIGTAEVEIMEVEFAPDGNLNNPTLESGQVIVTNAPTYTATFTLASTVTQTTDPAPKGTQTPTKTKTPTRTRTATQARTPTPTRTTWSSSGEETTLTATSTWTPSALSEGGESTSQGYPMEAGEEGYPVRSEVTLTGTNAAMEASTSVSGMDELAESEMDEAPSNNAGDRAEEGSNGALATASQAGWLNFALWGVLILGIIVIVIMIFILMKRQRNTTEDLLL